MEKFTTYRDKGTGISPFLPSKTNENGLSRYLVRPICFVLVLPFFLLSSASMLVLSLFLPSILLRPLIRAYIYTFFGVRSIEFLVDGVKKSNTKAIDSSRPASGTVFINFSSPIDSLVLYVISRANPEFYAIAGDGKMFKVGSAWNCFIFALGDPYLKAKHPAKKLSKLSFVIVEGTTTNNRSVMRFPDGFDGSLDGKCISIKQHPTTLTTPIPESLLHFIYRSISTFGDTKYKLKLFTENAGSEDKIRENLSNYGKLKLLGKYLTLDKKAEFVQELEKKKLD